MSKAAYFIRVKKRLIFKGWKWKVVDYNWADYNCLAKGVSLTELGARLDAEEAARRCAKGIYRKSNEVTYTYRPYEDEG